MSNTAEPNSKSLAQAHSDASLLLQQNQQLTAQRLELLQQNLQLQQQISVLHLIK